ncbi:MAG: hypothetical protein Q4E11_01620 [Corynebacterium sp.]|uniref:hypothetical protein n=1 Tax=Corynebacterium sp. TaxID=1720 RepID=UPI0026DAA658|nr:hypothetical protein [Corynebacterium sp.]MDO5029267.1 hypothetical protein [Corynebacterium sp.]
MTKQNKPNKQNKRAGLFTRLLADEQLRSAIWFGAAAFLVFYLGAMLLLRLVMVDGSGSSYDSIIIAVVALIAAVIAGRKRYNDDV